MEAKQKDYKEIKRVIIIPPDDEWYGVECCISKERTTGIELLRKAKEEYGICISDEVKTPVSLTTEGTDSYLECLAASGYVIVVSLILEYKKNNSTNSWAYLPEILATNQQARLKHWLAECNIDHIDTTQFISLQDGNVVKKTGSYFGKLTKEKFLEMTIKKPHTRSKTVRITNPSNQG